MCESFHYFQCDNNKPLSLRLVLFALCVKLLEMKMTGAADSAAVQLHSDWTSFK